jgi:hypothetical protein
MRCVSTKEVFVCSPIELKGSIDLIFGFHIQIYINIYIYKYTYTYTYTYAYTYTYTYPNTSIICEA